MSRTRVALSVTLLLALAVLVAAPAVARGGTPEQGLARIDGASWSADTFPYAMCFVCDIEADYPWENWSDGNRQYVGHDSKGRLLVLTMGDDRGDVALRVLSATTYATAARRVVPVPADFQPAAAYISPVGHLYLLFTTEKPQSSIPFMDPNGNHALDNKTIALVREYDTLLNVVGTSRIYGGTADSGLFQVPYVGNTSMLEVDNRLIVHTTRAYYHFPGDQYDHHQGSVVLDIDRATRKVTVASDGAVSESSHSFAEYLGTVGDSLLVLNHSDGGPRGVGLQRMHHYFAPELCPVDPELGQECPKDDDVIFKFPGDMQNPTDNFTGTTVNGFAVQGTTALTTGVSQPHQHAIGGVTDSGHNLHYNANLYVVATNLATRNSTYRWLTTYSPKNHEVLVGQPALLALSNGKFALLFQIREASTGYGLATGVRSRLEYRLLDSSGAVLAKRTWTDAHMSLASDLHKFAGKLWWIGGHHGTGTAMDSGGSYLFGLDMNNPNYPRLMSK